MPKEPVKAVQVFHCQDCGHEIKVGEPVYNLANMRICTVCWSAPPAGGGK